MRNNSVASFGCITQLVIWFLLALVAEHLAGYILGNAFGDTAPWDALPAVARYGIAAILAHPIFVLAIVVFVLVQFIPTPFF